MSGDEREEPVEAEAEAGAPAEAEPTPADGTPPPSESPEPEPAAAPEAPGSPVAEPPAEKAAAGVSPADLGLGDSDSDDEGVVVRRRRNRNAVIEEDDSDDSDEDDEAAKKRKRREQFELDEDDYDLLEDNQVTGFKRRVKKKRLKKASDAEKAKPKTTGDLEKDLFGESDDEDEPDKAEAAEELKDLRDDKDVYKKAAPKEEFVESDEDSEDEFADFIEREEGQPKRKKIKSHITGVRSEQLQDAVDIFGDLGELNELFAMRHRVAAEEDDEDEDDDDDDEDAEDDAENLAEEGDEALDAAPKPKKAKKAKKKKKKGGGGLFGGWQSRFEPSIVKEQMLTAADDDIRSTDWPERMQLQPRRGGKPEDVQVEAKWIMERLMGVDSVRDLPTFGGELLLTGWADDVTLEEHRAREQIVAQQRQLPQSEVDALVAAIANTLKAVHEDGLEVAHIAQNMGDMVEPLMRGRRDDSRPPPRDANGAVLERRVHRRDVIHEVMEWDGRFARLSHRRKEMMKKVNAVAEILERDAAPESDLSLLSRMANECEDAPVEEVLNDVEANLTLRFHEQLTEVEQSGKADGSLGLSRQLRPLNRSQYAHHCKKGIRDLLPTYGADPKDLGASLGSYRRTKVSQNVPDMTPEDVAEVYVGDETGYADVASVIRSLVHVAAAEIAAEPAVRSWLRRTVRRKACVWTQPTPAGTELIDPFHSLAEIKRLQGKPACEFNGAEFGAVLKAHRDGLVKLKIALPENVIRELTNEMESAYLIEEVSEMADAWNKLRKDALAGAKAALLPALTREAAAALEREASAEIRRTCGESLWRRIALAPWKPDVRDHDQFGDGDDVEVRVLAAVWGPGDPPTTFAMLDADGELVDFLGCPNIAAGGRTGAAPARRQVDMDRLIKFIIEHRPHVCVVATAPGQAHACRALKEGIGLVIGRILEDHARAIPEEVNTIALHFVDDTIPALAASSNAMRTEFLEHSAEIRHAVALGRYIRNSAAVVAALAAGGEAKALNLGPLQDALTPEEKIGVVERGLIDVINQCGVDLNAAVAHPWQQYALHYVAGLGPRKAGALVSAVRGSTAGALESRDALVSELDALGPCVYKNAATSLRVLDEDVLDATRIHPERYGYCLEIIANALDYDYEQLKTASASVKRKTLERAMDPENWEKLAVLDLKAYAEYLRGTNGGEWLLSALRELRMELREPYGEIRAEWQPLGTWEEFSLLTGETRESLSPGKIVHCVVKRLVPPRREEGTEGHVLVQLESGVMGHIAKSDLSDNPVDRLEHKVAVGQNIAARIINCNYEEGTVYLKCKGSALSAEESKRIEYQTWGHKQYYLCEPLDGEVAKPAKPKKRRDAASKQTFISRNIDHPLFQNVSAQQAQAFLEQKDVGDIVLRPSSKGVTNLSITMKIFDSMVQHFDIKEGKKPGVGHTANLALGTPLTLEGTDYDDLDEVYARFVEPLVSSLKKVIKHRKFLRGTRREVDQRLKAELARYPNTRPYALSVSHEHSGFFCLSSILSRSGNVRHEYLSVKPSGFRFRQREFGDVDRLLNFFKQRPVPDREQTREQAPPPLPSQPPPQQYQQQQQWQQPQQAYGGYPQGMPPMPPMPQGGYPQAAYQNYPPQQGGYPPQQQQQWQGGY